jgi:uncharacterized protein (DUF2147 family)
MARSFLRAVVVLSVLLWMSPFVFASSKDGGVDNITGQWLTAEDESVVEIYKCEDTLCLKIVWLKEPFRDDGTQKVDENNPDTEKRTNGIIGMRIGSGFEYQGDKLWEGGNIYDPNSGKTYSCKIKLKGDELNVRGFIGVSLFGRTEMWKRR